MEENQNGSDVPGTVEQPLIYKALADVMASVGAIGKEGWNQQQRFNFRGIDDVYNALHPALVKSGVVVVPEVLEHRDVPIESAKGNQGWRVVIRVRFRFVATDGSHVDAVTIGEAADYADKASNKAMSVAYKYAIFQVFCIPTEDQEDPDASSPETGVAAARKRHTEPDTPADRIQALADFEEALTDKFGANDAEKQKARAYFEGKLGTTVDKAPAPALRNATANIRERMKAEDEAAR